jgi:hypothetical protein
MENSKRNEYLTRNGVLRLMSDDEVASVCMAETKDHLAEGEEYLDLEKLDQGVLQAPRTVTPMGRVLPRKAVHEKTWEKILALVKAHHLASTKASSVSHSHHISTANGSHKPRPFST